MCIVVISFHFLKKKGKKKTLLISVSLNNVSSGRISGLCILNYVIVAVTSEVSSVAILVLF
jgi:hypothetical protein